MVNAANPLPHNGNFFPRGRNFSSACAYAWATPQPPDRHITIYFQSNSKKIAIRLKALFAAPLSPFEAASSLMAAT